MVNAHCNLKIWLKRIREGGKVSGQHTDLELRHHLPLHQLPVPFHQQLEKIRRKM